MSTASKSDFGVDDDAPPANEITESSDAPSLDSVMCSWFEDRRACGYSDEEYRARWTARNHLSLYAREKNGLLIWRAYREFRQRGLPVPEVILGHLDQWAEALEKCSGPREISIAIEMSRSSGGGAQGAAQLAMLAETRRLVSRIAQLANGSPGCMTEKKAIERIASENGIAVKALEKRFYAWKRKTKMLEEKLNQDTPMDLGQVWRC